MKRRRLVRIYEEEDRRAHERYSIGLDLWFTVHKADLPELTAKSGVGRSINISRTGLLFLSSNEMSRGDDMIVGLKWPVCSENGAPLWLLASGSIVRTESNRAATAFSWCELVSDTANSTAGDLFRQASPPPSSSHLLIPVVESFETYLQVVALLSRRTTSVQHVSVEQALALLKSQRVSLLITNTLREFASQSISVPVIYLTTDRPDEQLPPEIESLKSIAVLQKPVSGATLRGAIRRLRRSLSTNGLTAA